MTRDGSPEATDGVVVVEFSLADPDYPFIGLSAAEDCTVSLQKMLPRGEGEYSEYFSISGADPDRVLALAEANELVEPNLVERYDFGGLFEFLVEGFCPARELAEAGAIPREISSEGGAGRIVVEIPPDEQPTEIIDGFLQAHATAELVTKQTRDRVSPLFTRNELESAVDERLTSRQEEVLRTAFDASYYDPAGATTIEDLGDRLGISPSTVSQHLQAAERKLVTILLEDESTGS